MESTHRLHFYAARLLAIAAGGLLSLGCDNSPRHYPVAGTITLDGKPVPDGEIVFFSVDGGPPDAGPIEAGSFSMQCVSGTKRVQVTATRDHPTQKVPGASPGVCPMRRLVSRVVGWNCWGTDRTGAPFT